MKYFVFAMFFICATTTVSAQGFFVPNGVFSSSAEKLKPLNKETQEKLSGYSQRRYKVIDGRVMALPNEPDLKESAKMKISDTPLPSTEPLVQNPMLLKQVPSNNPSADSEPIISVQNIKENHIQSATPVPTSEPFNKNLPVYKNRYTQYLKDLQTFQKTGSLPKNYELDDMLQKFTARREIILFDGEVK